MTRDDDLRVRIGRIRDKGSARRVKPFIAQALAALEQNNVLPILKPVPRRGRAPSSHGHAALKGHVAATVKRLTQTGMELKEAHRKVANELKKLGVRPGRGSGQVTANTVRNWCDEVASDVGRHGTAALMCGEMFTDEEQKRFSALSQRSGKVRCACLTCRLGPVPFSEPGKNYLNPPFGQPQLRVSRHASPRMTRIRE
ncbi:MAG: hypothetical protein WBW73_28980 [Rhodoplanes sp.]